uniref:Uncharacterized protein n=1 Tax=Rhizophora mucronata TaxID=61149 RepID=A0A2P2PIZ6_RHIMU
MIFISETGPTLFEQLEVFFSRRESSKCGLPLKSSELMTPVLPECKQSASNLALDNFALKINSDPTL